MIMVQPVKNRLSPYEAGWLSMLVVNGLATRESIRRSQCRDGVRRPTITDLHEQRVRRLQQRDQDRRRSG